MSEVELEYIKSYISIDVRMFQCGKSGGRIKGPTGIFSWQNIPFMFITCHLMLIHIYIHVHVCAHSEYISCAQE